MCPDADATACGVVVADDHPIWRDAVERDLAAAGLAVVGVAGDGDKAVRVCAATRPDVLVCDLQMPGLSGVEVDARRVAAGRRGCWCCRPAASRRTCSRRSRPAPPATC